LILQATDHIVDITNASTHAGKQQNLSH